MYDNEYKTKENKNWAKDKIELQHVNLIQKCVPSFEEQSSIG